MKKPLQLNEKKTPFLWSLLGFIVLLLILSGCGQRAGSFFVPEVGYEYRNPYKIGKDEPYGIVEFFNITSFGLFMKGLEKGPESRDENAIWMYTSQDDEPQMVGLTFVPQVGSTLAAGDWSLAFNFSFCRVALPPGEYSGFRLAVGPSKVTEVEVVTTAGDVISRYKGKEYAFRDAILLDTVISVQPNRITLVRVHAEKRKVERKKDKSKRKKEQSEGEAETIIIIKTFQTPITLPIPPNPKMVSADPNSISELCELLNEEDWGLRWYAARRLAALGDGRAIQPIQQALEKEKHIDVREALEDALKDSQ